MTAPPFDEFQQMVHNTILTTFREWSVKPEHIAFTDRQIERAIIALRKNVSPGIDGITVDVHVRASKMEDGKCGAQTRCHLSHFNIDFRLETDIQESSCLEWMHAISNVNGSVLFWCWAACESWRKMRERTWYDALTYISSKQRMR